MTDEHAISALSEPHRIDGKTIIRWRGRCSCGHQTFMHYSSQETARTALKRTHLMSIEANSDL